MQVFMQHMHTCTHIGMLYIDICNIPVNQTFICKVRIDQYMG